MTGRLHVTLSGSARRWALVAGRASLLAVLLTAGATSCAGTTEVTLPGPEATTAPLTKLQYTTRANEICRATTKAIAQRTEQVGQAQLDASGGGDRQKLTDEVAPIAALAMTRLRNLTPPPADAALVDAGLDAMQAAIDAIGTDPAAPLDPVGLNRPELFDYGLTACFSKR